MFLDLVNKSNSVWVMVYVQQPQDTGGSLDLRIPPPPSHPHSTLHNILGICSTLSFFHTFSHEVPSAMGALSDFLSNQTLFHL